ncbi:hypothetical protein [Paraburkholderia piptadeniae]|nr:hypothetical protein [Paraburkholderia piptadeniae]
MKRKNKKPGVAGFFLNFAASGWRRHAQCNVFSFDGWPIGDQ